MTYESSGSLRCSWPSCLKASDPTRRAACSANEPNSVGHFVPYGCISMFNEDIEDLYRRWERAQGFVEKITATRSLLLLLEMPINRAFLLTLPRATNIP